MKKYQKLSKNDLSKYLELNEENYFLAVGAGSDLGIGSVQLYLNKNDFSICIAHFIFLKNDSQMRHTFYLCDEHAFRVVSQADDLGRNDEEFAYQDFRGKSFAFNAFYNLLNLSKGL